MRVRVRVCCDDKKNNAHKYMTCEGQTEYYKNSILARLQRVGFLTACSFRNVGHDGKTLSLIGRCGISTKIGCIAEDKVCHYFQMDFTADVFYE